MHHEEYPTLAAAFARREELAAAGLYAAVWTKRDDVGHAIAWIVEWI